MKNPIQKNTDIERLLGGPQALEALGRAGFSDPAGALRNLRLLSEGPCRSALDVIFRSASDSPSPDGALNNLESIAGDIPKARLEGFLSDPLDAARLLTICGSSPYLSSILRQNPELLGLISAAGKGLEGAKDAAAFRAELEKCTEGAADFDSMARQLRIYRHREFFRIGAKDLLWLSTLKEITAELSDLASASLDAAVEFSIGQLKKTYGEPLYEDEDGSSKEAVFTVMGLGKLGGRELNFSSDIDIIYIYSSDRGETGGVEGRPESKISLHAFFVKAAMTVNKLIGAVTGDGMVFRIDLDLRPEGRGGDMANSLRSAEVYYESWGQSWERAAMIKARPVAGSIGLGEDFLSMIRPFVFRKYLDFTAIEEIKSMKEKIDLSLLRRNPDTIDVKLGAGGIREIEFFCQALELIHGGKDPQIREKNTLDAIDRLTEKGFLKKDEAEGLREGYIFLRNLEHRIQIVEGRQSQAIPAGPQELERLARMLGFGDRDGKKAGEFFWEEYKKRTSRVHDIYRSLFYRPETGEKIPQDILQLLTPEIPAEEAEARLGRLGFKDPKAAYDNLTLLRTGPQLARLGPRAQVLLQRLAPLFLSRASSSPDPDRALGHLERFLASIGARTTFYSLLSENPKVLDELLRLFGSSVFLSRALIERPEGLDILLSKELAIPYKHRKDFDFTSGTLALESYEERLDELRILKNQEILRTGINDIAGNLSSRQVSAQITFTAEACLEAALAVARAELEKTYGRPEGSAFFILGLGKLGGKEMIYGSDLDIIFVYSAASGEARTTGPRAISHHEFFVKLGQRIISVLTLRTKEGFVFNVDARLRPSGSSGPLVVSKEALLKYHAEPTQVWERQALVKARVVAGDRTTGCAVLKGLKDALYAKPLTQEDIDEMLRIRMRMETEIAKEDASRYNIKTGRGGMVDIEFLAQALQLRYGLSRASLKTPYTSKALKRLLREKLLGLDEYGALKAALSFFRLLEMRLRVVYDRPEGYLYRDSEELLTLARRAGYTGADAGRTLLDDYLLHAQAVRALYLKALEGLKAR